MASILPWRALAPLANSRGIEEANDAGAFKIAAEPCSAQAAEKKISVAGHCLGVIDLDTTAVHQLDGKRSPLGSGGEKLQQAFKVLSRHSHSVPRSPVGNN